MGTTSHAVTERGSSPPRIADDVYHVWSVISWCCHGDTATVQAEVAAKLRTHLPDSLQTWSARVMDEHESSCSRKHPLRPTHDRTGLSVDDAVAAVVDAGGDGELIASEVVIRESTRHYGLIHKEISKLSGHLPGHDPADLLGFGWRGLRVALRQFDPSRGFTFSTFACPKINGAIRDGVRAEHHLPKRLTTYARKVSAAEAVLAQQLNRPVSFADIAAYLAASGEPVAAEDLVARLSSPASLEEVLSSPRPAPAALVDEVDPGELAQDGARREDLLACLAALPADEREVITEVFMRGSTLTAAAATLGVDLRTARALRASGLARLRERMEHWAYA